ncbi:MAG: hypothetical protein WDN46_08890 [Methylocella sp.]
MADIAPIHALRDRLEKSRLQAIEELAEKGGAPSADALRNIALLQIVLTAVEDEIEAHEVRIGGGAETPLR